VKQPIYAQIEPTAECNLRCLMCIQRFRMGGPRRGPEAFMAWEIFEQILADFTDLERLHLQGTGEPLLHPLFFDMVGYAAARGVQVSTSSNLLLLNPRRAEACVTSGLHVLHVSIDGASAPMYERIRVRGDFQRVIRNLELVQSAKERLGSPYPHIHLVMVLMRQNLHELPDLVGLAHASSADELFVQHLCHSYGESALPEEYTAMRDFVDAESLLGEAPGRLRHYYQEARGLAKELGIRLRLPRTEPPLYPPGTPGRERCDWPWTSAYINYEGYAMPCCMISTPDRCNFGKINERGALAVWNGEAYQRFRDQLDSDTPPEVCLSCSMYWSTF
jgi:radical SAM protein with 4Fe4S-binding SPASM domain